MRRGEGPATRGPEPGSSGGGIVAEQLAVGQQRVSGERFFRRPEGPRVLVAAQLVTPVRTFSIMVLSAPRFVIQRATITISCTGST
jgi:hypothetical protein